MLHLLVHSKPNASHHRILGLLALTKAINLLFDTFYTSSFRIVASL